MFFRRDERRAVIVRLVARSLDDGCMARAHVVGDGLDCRTHHIKLACRRSNSIRCACIAAREVRLS